VATEAQIQWVRFPLIALHSRARAWLQIQANLGLAHNTIEAYGRALEDYLKFSSNSSLNIEAATQEHISQYVHHLTNKPQLSETNVRRIDSKAGLANATIQQRLTAVRLYYDYLVEEGIRKTNPVGRGKYTPGKGFAGNRERSLVRRYTKLPWIPNEEQWLQIVQAAKAEPLRNRVMFALAYDSALRREELCCPTGPRSCQTLRMAHHPELTETDGGVLLAIHVQPGAGRTEVRGSDRHGACRKLDPGNIKNAIDKVILERRDRNVPFDRHRGEDLSAIDRGFDRNRARLTIGCERCVIDHI